MNAAQLLAYFDRISEAPDAISRLRRLILDLAARGKLVEQDPKDEPASELLKCIQMEQEELIRAGALKRSDIKLQLPEGEVPFDLPATWQWAPLGSLIVFGPQNGISPKPSSHQDAPKAITLTATTSGTFDPNYFKHVEANIPSDSEFWLRPGDLLFQRGNTREYVGIAAYYVGAPGLFLYPDLMMKVRITESVSLHYIHLCAVAPHARSYFSAHASGAQSTMPKINQGTLVKLPVPLPPLAEQHRIVSRAVELMALCDCLGAAQAERENRRNRLAAASLQRLSQPTEAEVSAFREHARFHLRHFERFTTLPEHIQQLRQAILDLAVCGKLVPQDSKEEPASELFERIRTSKARLLGPRIVPRQKLASIDPGGLPSGLPSNWQAILLGDVCNFVTSGSRGWAEFYSDTGPGFIRAQNIRFGKLWLDDLACVNPPQKTEGTRTQVAKGDLLIVITGAGVTNPALLDQDLGEAYVSQHVALVRPQDISLSRWLLLCLMAPTGGRAKLVECAYGAGKPGLNLDNIRSLRIPLPPLAEQRRILGRVDELLDLCDRLEAQLATAQAESRRLLDAVLHEALTYIA